MNRRLVVPGSLAALALGALVIIAPADAAPAPRGAICTIAGTAKISPGLGATAKAQKVTISVIKLTNCTGGSAGAPGVPKKYTGTATTSPNPVSTNASCAAGNLNLSAAIRFSTGTTASVKVATTGLLANQAIKGNATASTDPAIKPGDLVAGDVVFRPTAPTQNCAVTPVTAVTFQGVLGVGSPK